MKEQTTDKTAIWGVSFSFPQREGKETYAHIKLKFQIKKNFSNEIVLPVAWNFTRETPSGVASVKGKSGIFIKDSDRKFLDWVSGEILSAKESTSVKIVPDLPKFARKLIAYTVPRLSVDLFSKEEMDDLLYNCNV